MRLVAIKLVLWTVHRTAVFWFPSCSEGSSTAQVYSRKLVPPKQAELIHTQGQEKRVVLGLVANKVV